MNEATGRIAQCGNEGFARLMGGARRAVVGTFKLDRRSYYSTAVFLVSRHCLSLGQQTTYGPSKRNVREK